MLCVVDSQTPENEKEHTIRRSAIGEDKQSVRAHVIEIELVLGQLNDIIADLLVSHKGLGGQSLDVFDGVLPARRGLRWRQGCHRGVRGELKVQVGVVS